MQTMPFGKHKGQPFSDLPDDYLRWLAGQDLREPLRARVDAELAARQQSGADALDGPVEDADGDDRNGTTSPPRAHQCPTCGASLMVSVTSRERQATE